MSRTEKGYRRYIIGETVKSLAIRIENGGDSDSSAEFDQPKREASKGAEGNKGKAG